jgi:hypothetical protein
MHKAIWKESVNEMPTYNFQSNPCSVAINSKLHDEINECITQFDIHTFFELFLHSIQ